MRERPGMAPAAVSACVINCQGRESISATLEALEASADPFDEIILIDSGSTDGSVELVRRRFPRVRLKALPQNRGPAVARNIGSREARNDLILFVDHDVLLERACGRQLLRAIEAEPEAVLALPRVRWADRPEVVQFEGADSHFLGFMSLRNAGGSAGDLVESQSPCGSMVSACFLFHRGRWGREPPFDERFEFNYEDHDFGIRCRLAGHRIIVVPSASCFHGGGSPGFSVRGDQEYPRKRVFCLIRGRWTILIKTYQVRTLLLLGPLFFTLEGIQFLVLVRRGWVWEWFRALGHLFLDLRGLAEERKRLQRGRRIPDRAILLGGALPIRPEFPKGWMERSGLSFFDRISNRYWRSVVRDTQTP